MILLVDSYDSFSNNLVQLISKETGKEVICIHNDSIEKEKYEEFFSQYLRLFDYIVIGPGPGHPKQPTDVGIISHLIKHLSVSNASFRIPILGICLGFQCLCYEFGCTISTLEHIRHGQVFNVIPEENDDQLYTDSKEIECVRYHSLYVENLNDEVVPLAYCYDSTEEQAEGKKILMAGKHAEFPFYGVQYHPESICSKDGNSLIHNFDRVAKKYNEIHRVDRWSGFKGDKNLLVDKLKGIDLMREQYLINGGKFTNGTSTNAYVKKFQLNNNDVNPIRPIHIADYFFKKDNETNFIFLNSASAPGEWSIIGCLCKDETKVFSHSVDSPGVIRSQIYGSKKSEKTVSPNNRLWSFLGDTMKANYVSRDSLNKKLGNFHHRELPFFGGLMGYLSYEEGQDISVDQKSSICDPANDTPDTKLAFVEKSILFDHKSNDWFAVAITDDAQDWCEAMVCELTHSYQKGKLSSTFDDVPQSVREFKDINEEDIKIRLPDKDIYKNQFKSCQDYLKSGDSYELCLTTQSIVGLPSRVSSWNIYKVISIWRNPSPFSCFMEFEDCSLISTSPERFLSWKDDESQTKIVEFRPIKGTVKKGPGVDFAQANDVLNTPKEKGENLMIVDLIRHDLHRFTDKVTVPQLMSVEEYKTVYQLVSVIKGELPSSGYHGIDILHKSLPPGSMTGAPKKRSVELLQEIEAMQPTSPPGGRRGVYSGVVGYWSITDDADWSVIIRSLFKYTRDSASSDSSLFDHHDGATAKDAKDTSIWRIGAGGAITVLSECESEWQELTTKLYSTLQAFKNP